jgi:hypothetical protein
MSDLKSEKIFGSQTSSSTLKDEKGGKIKYPFPMEGEQFTNLLQRSCIHERERNFFFANF